jgi:hypothetical protein
MDWELFKRITKEMRGLGVQEIGVFYIGESFTNPHLLVSAIKYLKSELETPYVFLTSNASLANFKVVGDCMDAGLDSLKWSCNAADDDQFNELMGVHHKNYYAAILNIEMAKKIRDRNNFKTKLYASSILYNNEQPKRAHHFLETYVRPYVDEHYWLPLYTAGGQAKEKEAELGMKPIAGNTGRLDDPSQPIPCWTLFTAAHIMVDGKMTGCCLDGIGSWVMGDLTKNSFMECWHSKDFQDLRKAHIDNNITGTKCEKCVLY